MDPSYAPPPHYVADSRARPPGIAMMIAGGFFAFLTMVGGGLYLALFGFAAITPSSPSSTSSPQDETVGLVILITILVVTIGVMLVIHGLIIFGGWSLMHRRR